MLESIHPSIVATVMFLIAAFMAKRLSTVVIAALFPVALLAYPLGALSLATVWYLTAIVVGFDLLLIVFGASVILLAMIRGRVWRVSEEQLEKVALAVGCHSGVFRSMPKLALTFVSTRAFFVVGLVRLGQSPSPDAHYWMICAAVLYAHEMLLCDKIPKIGKDGRAIKAPEDSGG